MSEPANDGLSCVGSLVLLVVGWTSAVSVIFAFLLAITPWETIHDILSRALQCALALIYLIAIPPVLCICQLCSWKRSTNGWQHVTADELWPELVGAAQYLVAASNAVLCKICFPAQSHRNRAHTSILQRVDHAQIVWRHYGITHSSTIIVPDPIGIRFLKSPRGALTLLFATLTMLAFARKSRQVWAEIAPVLVRWEDELQGPTTTDCPRTTSRLAREPFENWATFADYELTRPSHPSGASNSPVEQPQSTTAPTWTRTSSSSAKPGVSRHLESEFGSKSVPLSSKHNSLSILPMPGTEAYHRAQLQRELYATLQDLERHLNCECQCAEQPRPWLRP